MKTFNSDGYIVRLSEQSLISILMSALEAYTVENQNISHGDKVQLETFGHLFGQEINLSDGKSLYNVEFVHTDTTAKQNNGEVLPNDDALALKRDLTCSFWPHLSYLGDFHTHPDEHVRDIKKLTNFYFSKGDRDCLLNNKHYFESVDYRVGLVVAVASLDKRGTKFNDWHGSQFNRVEITKGNLRIWIGCYVAFINDDGDAVYSKDNDPDVMLDIPSLMGLTFEHVKFGKVHGKSKDKKYVQADL